MKVLLHNKEATTPINSINKMEKQIVAPQNEDSALEAQIALHKTDDLSLKLKAAINESLDGIAIINISGEFEFINPAWAFIHGMTTDECKEKTVNSLYFQNKSELAVFLNLAKEKGKHEDELKYTDKNGNDLSIWLKATVFSDNKAVASGFIIIARDISGQKYTEEKLAKSEAFLKKEQKIAKIGSWEWNIKTNVFSFSEEMCRIYGISENEYFDNIFDLISNRVHPDDHQVMGEAVNHLMKQGSGESVAYRIIWPDGNIRWISSSKPDVAKFDENGTPEIILGSVRDITEQKKAEDYLLELKAAIEQSVDGIIITDIQGQIKFVNSSWAEMHGLTLAEIKKYKKTDVHTKEQLEKEFSAFSDQVMKKGKHEGEIGHVTKNGRSFPTWTSEAVLYDNNGNPTGFISITRNITAQKQAEKELADAQKEIVKQAHQSGMADIAIGTIHNIGNILNSVKTSTQILHEIVGNTSLIGLRKANNLLRENINRLEEFVSINPKGKKLMQYYLKLEEGFSRELKSVSEHIDRLSEKTVLMEEVIAAQQSYAGRSSMIEPFVLSEILDDAITMQSGSLSKYNIKIEKHIKDVPMVNVQKTKLIHILINIIRNAKDAMIDNKVDRRVIKFCIDCNNEAIFLRTTDTGHGIALENLERIFSHGFTTKITGHGFGLHSSANYMNEMGCRMWAESEGLNKGATFVLRFPIKTTN